MTVRHNILVVEDEIIEAMFLRKILELWGYDVCELTTAGENAVQEARLGNPDLVLMDITINGRMSGLEAAGKIRTQLGIPIIFITGYSDEETRRQAEAVSPAGYFVKPIDYDTLKARIASVLRQDNPKK